MSNFDLFVQRLKEDGFSDMEIEFLGLTENTFDRDSILKYVQFGEAYDEIVEQFISTINEYHSRIGIDSIDITKIIRSGLI